MFFAYMGFFWIIAGIAAMADRQALAGLACVSIGLLPMAFPALRKKLLKSRRAAAHAHMLATAGVDDGSEFTFAENDSGMAVNVASRTLALRSGKRVATCRFSDVRCWSARVEASRRRSVVHYGLAGVATIRIASVAELLQARNEGWFWVDVGGVDTQVWPIEMSRPADREKWDGILRQVVAVSRSAGPPAAPIDANKCAGATVNL